MLMAEVIKPISPRKLTAYYMAALLVIAGLSAASHVILARVIHQNDGSAAIINLSGRQRMLSQRIASLAAQYRLGDPTAQPALTQAIDKFTANEATLSALSEAETGDGPNALALRALYAGPGGLDTQTRTFIANARRVASLPATSPAAAPALAAVFAASRTPLLAALNEAVSIHQAQSERSTAVLQLLQWALLAMVLFTLLVEARVIFRPMVNRVILYTDAVWRLARIDPLTELANRRGFLERFEAEYATMRRRGTPLAVLMLDADNFKKVNDHYGHDSGDTVLRAIAAALQKPLRASDVSGRLGGEEFAVLMPHTDLAGALMLAERVRGDIAALTIRAGDHDIQITVSIGVAQVPDQEDGITTALHGADEAMYEAKVTGRNRVVAGRVVSPMDVRDDLSEVPAALVA
jgi:diguanylate cyclase (GGDEF)-like protein